MEFQWSVDKVKGLVSERTGEVSLSHTHTETHVHTHRSHDEYSRGQKWVSITHLCWGEATVLSHSSISWSFDHYCTNSSRGRCLHVTQQNDVFTVHELRGVFCGAGQDKSNQCLGKTRESLVPSSLNHGINAEKSWMQRRSGLFQLL